LVQPDSAIVRRVQQGDTDAYEQLVARYERSARVAALRVVNDHHLAEDVVQQAFVIAYERLTSLRDGAKFGPWLLRITMRQAIRTARERGLSLSLNPGQEPADGSKTERLGEASEAVVELLGRLPAHERLVVTLRYLDGCEFREIAEMTGRPVGTVTKQVSRALRRLRRWSRNKESSS